MYNHEEAVNEAIRAMIAKPIFVGAVSRKVMQEINEDAGYAFAVAGHFYFAAVFGPLGTIALCKSSRTFDEDGVINGYDNGVIVKIMNSRRAAKAQATRRNRAIVKAA